MHEAHLTLESLRCPRCAGELVLRVLADERGRSLQLTLDTACIACGVSPWDAPDQRTVVFTPGASIASSIGGAHASLAELDPATRLAAAQSRIDSLLRRIEGLEHDLQAARRIVERASADERRRRSEVEQDLRADVSRLEGELADARAELRRNEEATTGSVTPGKRAIEIE